MGVYAKDLAKFVNSSSDDEPPLGDRLRGMADELDVDSVAEVRDVRERI